MHSHHGYWSIEDNIVYNGPVVNKSTLHDCRQFHALRPFGHSITKQRIWNRLLFKSVPILLRRFRLTDSLKQAFVEMM